MDDDKLYERVERALAAARFEGDNEALAAIAVIRPAVIEECARVADGFPAHLHGSLSAYDPAVAAQQAAREVGIAIRAIAAPRVEQEKTL